MRHVLFICASGTRFFKINALPLSSDFKSNTFIYDVFQKDFSSGGLVLRAGDRRDVGRLLVGTRPDDVAVQYLAGGYNGTRRF